MLKGIVINPTTRNAEIIATVERVAKELGMSKGAAAAYLIKLGSSVYGRPSKERTKNVSSAD